MVLPLYHFRDGLAYASPKLNKKYLIRSLTYLKKKKKMEKKEKREFQNAVKKGCQMLLAEKTEKRPGLV